MKVTVCMRERRTWFQCESMHVCLCVPICVQFPVCVLFLLPPSVPSALTSNPSSNVLSNKPMIIISVQY